jgi:probable HAF family extracellular repeat protein
MPPGVRLRLTYLSCAALIVFLLSTICTGQTYKVTKLSKPAKGVNVSIHGINSAGQVTGDAGEVFLWTPQTGMQLLGGSGGLGAAINDQGHIAGTFFVNGPAHAFLWTPAGFQDLGEGEQISNGEALNSFDQVAGEFTPNPSQSIFHAFFWTPDDPGFQDLGTLGGSNSFASGMNDSAQVVGSSETTGNGTAPFLWSANTGMQAIPSPFENAYAINNQGQVAGDSSSGHAALWTHSGGTEDLGALPGTTLSTAFALNNRGVAVGNSWSPSQTGFVFIWTEAEGMQNVNTLAKNKQQNWTAAAINDAGQIAINRKGGLALILTPIIKMAVASSQNPSQVGQSVTFTATASSIAGAPPDGEVITFLDSATVLGTAPLGGGTASFSTSGLTKGKHRITVSYPGDVNYASSVSKALKQVVE